MLHLITPLYRKNNLEAIYSSIINQIEDFRWHLIEGNNIVGCSDLDFLKEDERVIFYKIETRFIWGHEQRNYFISEIKAEDQDFCFFLDDDTILTQDLVESYENEKNSDTDLVLFSQKAGMTEKIRLHSHSLDDLDLGRCDIGSYIIRFKVLKLVKLTYIDQRNSDGQIASWIRQYKNGFNYKVEKNKFTRYNALSLNIF